MQDALDVVDAVVVGKDAAVAGLAHEGEGIGDGRVHVDGDHVGPGDHDVADGGLLQAQNSVDHGQLTLVGGVDLPAEGDEDAVEARLQLRGDLRQRLGPARDGLRQPVEGRGGRPGGHGDDDDEGRAKEGEPPPLAFQHRVEGQRQKQGKAGAPRREGTKTHDAGACASR